MDLAQTARRYALLIILCTGILAGFFLLGNSWAPGTPGSVTITPVPSGGNEIPAGVAAYCTVMEYDEARAADARVVSVTDDELRDFPEFQTRMNSSSNTVPWYNGARSTGDFIDCRNQFPAFWNLSCRNMSYAECTSPLQKSPVVFAYNGRYYFVSCLTGFGQSGHPGVSGSVVPPCP